MYVRDLQCIVDYLASRIFPIYTRCYKIVLLSKVSVLKAVRLSKLE